MWRELFKHICSEAHRLGLEVNMNNDAGWCGSGGPWITPELSMQRIVWTATNVAGPRRFDGTPAAAEGGQRIFIATSPSSPFPRPPSKLPASPDIQRQVGARAERNSRSQPFCRRCPPRPTIPRDRIVDLTASCDADGRLAWDVPPGNWTHLAAWATPPPARTNHPAPLAGLGLESDKLSKEAAEAASPA